MKFTSKHIILGFTFVVCFLTIVNLVVSKHKNVSPKEMDNKLIQEIIANKITNPHFFIINHGVSVINNFFIQLDNNNKTFDCYSDDKTNKYNNENTTGNIVLDCENYFTIEEINKINNAVDVNNSVIKVSIYNDFNESYYKILVDDVSDTASFIPKYHLGFQVDKK